MSINSTVVDQGGIVANLQQPATSNQQPARV
ncbi:Protein of unknown function [Propionibacterium freudenreichii]|nr:Protein of unknown function [Propionibacterium freudenreichii]